MKQFRILFISLILSLGLSCYAQDRIGLVLSGGGGKCAAQVGALEVIERAHVKVDYISGTSFGAVVGALYAAGYTPSELKDFFLSNDWMKIFKKDGFNLGKSVSNFFNSMGALFFGKDDSEDDDPYGLLPGEALERLFENMLQRKGVYTFSDLKIPFRCVLTDIDNLTEVVCSEGNLARALRATMSVPGLFKPVSFYGRTIVDGGLMNNYPVDVARRMGADYIIGVDVQVGPDEPFDFKINTNGLVRWSKERPDVKKRENNIYNTDLYIHPEVHDFSAASYSHDECDYMMRQGRYEAEKYFDRLKWLGY